MKTRHQALHELLVALFSEVELRALLTNLPMYGADLRANLPGAGSSLAEIAGAAIVLLERRGALDRAFFHRLAAERPRHASRIEHLGLAWDAANRGPSAVTVHGRGKRMCMSLFAGVGLFAVVLGVEALMGERIWYMREQAIGEAARAQCGHLSRGREVVTLEGTLAAGGGTPLGVGVVEHAGNLELGDCAALVVSEWDFPPYSEEYRRKMVIRFP